MKNLLLVVIVIYAVNAVYGDSMDTEDEREPSMTISRSYANELDRFNTSLLKLEKKFKKYSRSYIELNDAFQNEKENIKKGFNSDIYSDEIFSLTKTFKDMLEVIQNDMNKVISIAKKFEKLKKKHQSTFNNARKNARKEFKKMSKFVVDRDTDFKKQEENFQQKMDKYNENMKELHGNIVKTANKLKKKWDKHKENL